MVFKIDDIVISNCYKIPQAIDPFSLSTKDGRRSTFRPRRNDTELLFVREVPRVLGKYLVPRKDAYANRKSPMNVIFKEPEYECFPLEYTVSPRKLGTSLVADEGQGLVRKVVLEAAVKEKMFASVFVNGNGE